jgi:hypothetical protein
MLRRGTIIALVLAAIVGGHFVNESRFVGEATNMSGVVKSVSVAPPNENGFKTIAQVELADGTSVRASVLPACTAVPDDRVSLAGGRSSYFGRSYVIVSVEERK